MLVSGCAVTVDVPTNRFDSPETTGKLGRLKLEADFGGSNSVVLTPDITAKAPDTAHPTFDTTKFLDVMAGVGLMDKLDVDVRTDGGLAFEVKYQFLGAPRMTAKAGNFALAATLMGGGSTYNQDSSGLVGAGHVDQSAYFADAALVAGYRVLDPVLIYGGPFIRDTKFSGSYTQSSSIGAPSTSAGNYSGDVMSTGANIGVELGLPLVQFKLEGAYSNAKSGSVNTGRFFGGLGVAFQFGAH